MNSKQKRISSTSWYRAIAFILITAGFLLRGSAVAQEAPADQMRKEIIDLVLGDNLRLFDDLARNLNAEQAALRKELLRIFADPKSTSFARCSAGYYLGELRAEEAGAALAANINLKLDIADTHGILRGYSTLHAPPIADALVKIGVPAVPYMLKNMRDSSDVAVREQSAKVLLKIEGQEVAVFLLEKEIAKQSDSTKKEWLNAALEMVKKAGVK